jgi:hypothetical protein
MIFELVLLQPDDVFFTQSLPISPGHVVARPSEQVVLSNHGWLGCWQRGFHMPNKPFGVMRNLNPLALASTTADIWGPHYGGFHKWGSLKMVGL